MNKVILLLVFAVFTASLSTMALASDPDIERFYATPDEPYQYEDFDIYVRAEDDDGIDRIKLYRDGVYEDDCDCDGDERCSCRFELYESDYGYTTYKVKVYDEEGNTESDSIRVYIQRYDYDYPVYSNIQITNAYFTPSSVSTGQSFSAYMSAYSNRGVDRIELWHGGVKIATKSCYTTSCASSFTVGAKYSEGTYQYTFKAVDEDGRTISVIRSINVQEPYVPTPINTAPSLSSVTSNPANPTEGQTFTIYATATDSQSLSRIELLESGRLVGSQSCSGTQCSALFTQSKASGSYSFTIRAIDSNGLSATASKTVYVSSSSKTCSQLGGVCCSGDGVRAVSGSSDCPGQCYLSCVADSGASSTDSGSTSSDSTATDSSAPAPNIVLSGGEGSFLLFVGSLVVFFLLIVFARSTLKG